MRAHRTLVSVVAVAALLVAAGPAAAKKPKAAPTAPGSYNDWNGEIDRLEVVESFHRADYRRVVVAGFATGGVELPDSDDNAYQPVQEVLADVAGPLAEGLREEAQGLAVEVAKGEPPSEGGTLVLRGRVLEMDPGSRAARYWGGFGAGAARTKLEGELVDAASGRVLLRFTQERRSGVGVGGGSYVNLLQRNLRTIGEDMGAALQKF